MVEEQRIGSGLWLQLGLNSAQSQLQGPNNAMWEISRQRCVNNAWEVQWHLGDVSPQPGVPGKDFLEKVVLNWGYFCLTRGHFAISLEKSVKTLLGRHCWGQGKMLLESNGWPRTGMMLKYPTVPRTVPTANSYLAPNVRGAEDEKHGSQLRLKGECSLVALGECLRMKGVI